MKALHLQASQYAVNRIRSSLRQGDQNPVRLLATPSRSSDTDADLSKRAHHRSGSEKETAHVKFTGIGARQRNALVRIGEGFASMPVTIGNIACVAAFLLVRWHTRTADRGQGADVTCDGI